MQQDVLVLDYHVRAHYWNQDAGERQIDNLGGGTRSGQQAGNPDISIDDDPDHRLEALARPRVRSARLVL